MWAVIQSSSFSGTGHIARNCSQDEDTCYNCNEVAFPVLNDFGIMTGILLTQDADWRECFTGGSHREGLSQCGDEDLLQVRRYWSHLEGVPQVDILLILHNSRKDWTRKIFEFWRKSSFSCFAATTGTSWPKKAQDLQSRVLLKSFT